MQANGLAEGSSGLFFRVTEQAQLELRQSADPALLFNVPSPLTDTAVPRRQQSRRGSDHFGWTLSSRLLTDEAMDLADS